MGLIKSCKTKKKHVHKQPKKMDGVMGCVDYNHNNQDENGASGITVK